MRDIDELVSYMEKTPVQFGRTLSEGEVSDFDNSSTDSTNYENGFPMKYATDPTTAEGAYILRADMNAFGRLATNEMIFKRAGGLHGFSPYVVAKHSGYPQFAMFEHDDGIYLNKIQSEIALNNIDYNQSNVIDCLDSQGKKTWTTSQHIFGIEEGLFALKIDSTRVQKLQQGGVVNEDSLITVGGTSYLLDYMGNILWDDSNQNSFNANATDEFRVTVNIDNNIINIPNKGDYGIEISSIGIPPFWTFLYPSKLCGSANYSLCFFAKKGSSIFVSSSANKESINTTFETFAYPLITKIRETVNE